MSLSFHSNDDDDFQGQAGVSRTFETGFLTIYGKLTPNAMLPNVPGLFIDDKLNDNNHHTDGDGGDVLRQSHVCDYYETRAVFVLSNDDNENLGHYINDVAGIWGNTVLANRATNESVLLNIDGIRESGPAGGPGHRMVINIFGLKILVQSTKLDEII